MGVPELWHYLRMVDVLRSNSGLNRWVSQGRRRAMKMVVGLLGRGFVWVVLTAGANAWASEPLRGCAAKQAAIEQQLVQAREAGRKRQIAGLEKALKAHRSKCTDEGLRRERQAA